MLHQTTPNCCHQTNEAQLWELLQVYEKSAVAPLIPYRITMKWTQAEGEWREEDVKEKGANLSFCLGYED